MPSTLYFASGLEIRSTVVVPRRAGGLLGLTTAATFETRQPGPALNTAGTHIIFTREGLLPGSGPSEILLGNSGLLDEDWGTVLDTSEGEDGDLQVETDDGGTVLAVGLVAHRHDVSVRVRMLRSKPLPQRGRLFQFRGKNYVVLSLQRVTKSRAVREFTVNGSRWEDLGGQQVTPVTDTLAGWSG